MTQKPEKPEIHVTKTGVRYVLPSDIFSSEAGQRQIKKMAALKFNNPSNLSHQATN
ncbi:hypothetical protein HC928_25825 [bacterium]|nr:hypothetical protein [bacterium]